MKKPTTFKPEMATLPEWQDRRKRILYLANQLRRGRLGVALGAGVSHDFGLPGWGQLVDRLYQGSSKPKGDNAADRLVSHLRRTKFGGDADKLRTWVSQCLYRDFDGSFASIAQQHTLRAIAALAMPSVRGSASDIVTLNLDDLLERYLEEHGFVADAVVDPTGWRRPSDVRVYHIHGLIPSPGSPRAATPRYVLDEEAYSKDLGPWKQLALSLLWPRTWLFIGLSGKDKNLGSLIDAAWEAHAVKGTRTRYWGIWFNDKPQEIDVGYWEERGIFTVKTGYGEPLAKELFAIAQQAADGT